MAVSGANRSRRPIQEVAGGRAASFGAALGTRLDFGRHNEQRRHDEDPVLSAKIGVLCQ